MKCIFCSYYDSKVIDSRTSTESNGIRRRRECLKCGKRFTTYELVETTPILVVKRNGTRQAFDNRKIRNGIVKACEKRAVSMDTIDKMVENIEKQIFNSMDEEVQSSTIGELVLSELKKIDGVAYIRFASVYMDFRDLDAFTKFINDFEKK